MVTVEVPDPRTRRTRFRWVSVPASFVAAVLFFVSAVLQLMASLERWVAFRASWTGVPSSVEDHLFDYLFPWEPWHPIGTAAELYGVGTLIMAAGVLVMPLSVTAARAAARSGVVSVVIFIGEMVVALLVAGAVATHGTHAYISGVNGSPSPLIDTLAVGWVASFGLIALAVIWNRRSRAAMLACVFLIGNTLLGHLVAMYVIAPVISGGSHDTAVWTETVVAVSTGAAAVAMIFVALATSRRTALPATAT